MLAYEFGTPPQNLERRKIEISNKQGDVRVHRPNTDVSVLVHNRHDARIKGRPLHNEGLHVKLDQSNGFFSGDVPNRRGFVMRSARNLVRVMRVPVRM